MLSLPVELFGKRGVPHPLLSFLGYRFQADDGEMNLSAS